MFNCSLQLPSSATLWARRSNSATATALLDWVRRLLIRTSSKVFFVIVFYSLHINTLTFASQCHIPRCTLAGERKCMCCPIDTDRRYVTCATAVFSLTIASLQFCASNTFSCGKYQGGIVTPKVAKLLDRITKICLWSFKMMNRVSTIWRSILLTIIFSWPRRRIPKVGNYISDYVQTIPFSAYLESTRRWIDRVH